MKLASVEKIERITPIEGADVIETAHVLGWQIVTKRGEYQVGDLTIYVQIDTVTPDTEYFEFLRPRGFRVKTIKLRKQISQGLLVPLNYVTGLGFDPKEGDDVTDLVGIKKYYKDIEVAEPLPKMPPKGWKKWKYIIKYRFLAKIFPWMLSVNRNGFPKHLVPITDEERIQNMKWVLESHNGKEFVVSEKLDGSSITIIHDKKMFKKERYRICSRRFELFNTANAWYKAFESTNFKQHISNLVNHFQTFNIIVQGEFIGSPQGNKYQLKADEIRLFNIYVNGKRINQKDFYEVCTQLGVPCCPVVTVKLMDFDLPGILDYAEGKSQLNPQVEREGLVFRCVEDNLSFKVISNKYLLKNNE